MKQQVENFSKLDNRLTNFLQNDLTQSNKEKCCHINSCVYKKKFQQKIKLIDHKVEKLKKTNSWKMFLKLQTWQDS